MKRFFFLLFLLVFWSVAALFNDRRELIAVAGCAAVLCVLYFIPKKALALSLAAAVGVTAGIINVQFLLRCVPALMLIVTHASAVRFSAEGSGKNSAKPEGVYTGVILCALLSAGTLIYDIGYARRNETGAFLPERFRWILAGLLLFLSFAVFLVYKETAAPKKKAGHSRRSRGVLLPVYLCACVCLLMAAAGFLINATLYSVYIAVFPWLLFAADAALRDNVFTAAATRSFTDAAERFLTEPEETV